MAPRGRFELPTFRLTAERSTIELPGNGKQTLNLQYFAGPCSDLVDAILANGVGSTYVLHAKKLL